MAATLLSAAIFLGTVNGVGFLRQSCLPAGDEPLLSYLNSIEAGATFDLNVATDCVFQNTLHSDARRISPMENWLQWSLGQAYPPLQRTQDTRRLIAGGIGDCSERSQILKLLVEAAGHKCRFVGLTGHVVLEACIQGEWHTADPDYGVVYPCDVSTLAREASLLRRHLSLVGHNPSQIETYLALVQSTEDNIVLPVGSPLSPRLHAIERLCDWLAIAAPWALLWSAIALRSRAEQVVVRPFSTSIKALSYFGSILTVANAPLRMTRQGELSQKRNNSITQYPTRPSASHSRELPDAVLSSSGRGHGARGS
jgi:hypothetical protein